MALKEIQIGPFHGGLNTRDSAGELSGNEIPDALNVSIDDRGSVQKRLGYEKRFPAMVGSAGAIKALFHWGSRGYLVSQRGATMHIDSGAAFLTWTTDDRCGMCEFLGNLILIHPVDGVRMYDGTTVTGPFTNAPKGNTCAAWQNKCWFAGNPINPARVTHTDIGAMTFNVNGWVELREKDTAKVTLLTGASGLDVSGRPGLLAFKQDSAYRIYDSATGAFNTIDAAIGCGSSIGAVSAYGRTYVASPRGIYYTNGIDPMIEASNKIENLFHKDIINQDRSDLFAAGRHQDRIWFSFPGSGQTQNTIAIELHPHTGSVMAHTNAAAAYASLGRGDIDLIMGSTTNGYIYNSHRGGSDDGTDITSYLTTYWTEPNYGNLVRIRRARFIGYGAFDAALFRDYQSGQSGATLHVDISDTASVYDDPDAEYDDGVSVYGPARFQGFHNFWSLGTCRSFAIRVTEVSSEFRESRPVLGTPTRQVGAWTLGHINLLTIDLGMK
jgi:hypothetical protein